MSKPPSITDLPPWKRKRPGKPSTARLSSSQIAAARARAEQAGRRYPNLVDNMWAARLPPDAPVSE